MDYVIVADDLTGANATCSLLKKLGLKTCSILKNDYKGNELKDIDVVAYSTDSRGIDRKQAYERVYNVVKSQYSPDVLLYNKRIDSTLRGNIGTEILAMLEAINESDKIAIVVPSYPDSGRIVINQTMLVNGKLLKESDAGKDPKTPINTSDVKEIIETSLNENIAYISLDEVSSPMNELKNNILQKVKNSRVLVFDSVVNEDIIKIVKAIIELDLNIITVDPGPLTMYYTKELQKKHNKNKKILMVVGSATQTTKLQLENILQQEDILLVKINPSVLFNNKDREIEMKKVYDQVQNGIKFYDIVLVTTTPLGDDIKLDLEKISKKYNLTVDDISKIISNTLSEVAVNILQTNDFEGVYSSGGDITLSLLNKLNSSGIEIKDEIVPLAAYGRIMGGKNDNLKIVSKGGMVGDINTVKLCLNKIRNDI